MPRVDRERAVRGEGYLVAVHLIGARHALAAASIEEDGHCAGVDRGRIDGVVEVDGDGGVGSNTGRAVGGRGTGRRQAAGKGNAAGLNTALQAEAAPIIPARRPLQRQRVLAGIQCRLWESNRQGYQLTISVGACRERSAIDQEGSVPVQPVGANQAQIADVVAGQIESRGVGTWCIPVGVVRIDCDPGRVWTIGQMPG